MTDYENLRAICRRDSELTKSVVDDFLIYYAAVQDKLHQKTDQLLNRYRHITSQFDPSWARMLKSQYIAHRIFKKDGLIHKYLNHSALKYKDKQERAYLKEQANHPWRFSFSVIANNPAEDFYTMEDVFTGEDFLLYSPSTKDILEEQQVTIWFNLITFNGECCQTFGPIAHFQSFEPEDIRFFSTELEPDKWFETGEEIMMNVEKNPVPYMMLLIGALIPPVYHKGDRLVQVVAEYDLDSFDKNIFDRTFKVEYSHDVFRLGPKYWDIHPHFAAAYYDEKDAILQLTAMTDRGFGELVKKLRNCGFDVSDQPDFRVSMSMISAAGKILKKEIKLHDYESLFETKPSQEDEESLNKLDNLLSMAISEINAGRTPDIEDLARRAGVDVETAREMIEHIKTRGHL